MNNQLLKKEDVLEIYSFGIFLNLHIQLYYYFFNNYSFFNQIVYIVIFNFISNVTFRYHIFHLLTNKLWINNLHTISMPLLCNSLSNIVILNINMPNLIINKLFIELLLLLLSNYFIQLNYPNEIQTSKIFRYNITIFYFLVSFFL